MTERRTRVGCLSPQRSSRRKCATGLPAFLSGYIPTTVHTLQGRGNFRFFVVCADDQADGSLNAKESRHGAERERERERASMPHLTSPFLPT